MNNITLTIELGPVTQSKLDKILEALLQGDRKAAESVAATLTTEERKACTELVDRAAEAVQDKAEPAPEETTPAAEETAPEEATEAPEEAPAVTADDIRLLVQKLIAPGSDKGAKAKAIVQKYAPKVSGIPADKYQAVWAELNALDQEG